MIGFLVQGRVRVKIRNLELGLRLGVSVTVSVYHWSNCHRSNCTLENVEKPKSWLAEFTF